MKARRRRLKRNRQANSPKAEVQVVLEPKAATLVPIPQANVLECWPLADEFLKAACAESDLEPGELLAETLAGETQLWFAWSDRVEAAAITRLRVPFCIIVACGGKGIENWLGLLDGIEQWAGQNGCKTVRIFGRKGWARKLPDYRVTRFVLDKEL